jgi:hypothetical protein
VPTRKISDPRHDPNSFHGILLFRRNAIKKIAAGTCGS